jgi:hypothetical protein
MDRLSKIVHTGDSNGGDGDGRADKSKGGADKSWVAAFAPYDPMKREPLYAGAEHTCAWELTMVGQAILVVLSCHEGALLGDRCGLVGCIRRGRISSRSRHRPHMHGCGGPHLRVN